ncbi:MAG: glycoside hydrolase family 97 protein [Bacteroidota bacterium]|nr:glycoside hydrolase family 97 protein [Bacteroidota bacterium]
MKKILIILVSIISISCSQNNSISVESPNQEIKLNFKLIDGVPTYSVSNKNKKVINLSKMGLLFNNKIDFSKNLTLLETKSRSFNNSWKPLYGEEEIIINNYNELMITLSNTVYKMNIFFRLFNDGIAFKYVIPKQNELNSYDIIDEMTEFNLSSKDSALWIPAFSYRRYEFLYANSSVDNISKKYYSKNVEDISYDSLGIDAAHTPLTIKKDNDLYISIHEANLVDYSSMTLKPKGNGKLEVELYPWSDGIKVKSTNGINSPWRTVQIANNSSELLDSNIILNLNDDPDKNEDFSWVKPGKYMGVWWEMIGTNESTWWSSKNHGANNSKVINYIDFASKHGFDGLLVEGWNKGWYPQWCCSGNGIPFIFTETVDDFNIELLSRYGKEKNISLVGHHETGGQIQNYENQLEDAFKLYNKYGIKNIKTGYVNDVSKNIKRFDEKGNVHKEWHHGQYMVNHFQRVIEMAAKYKLNIITHEPIKDTGLRRKYPNYISREGAKGQEFNGFWTNGVNHATDLPFTRMLSGPMDYTPGIFQLNNFRYDSPDSKIIDKGAIVPSTLAKELALYVVYYSPMQMAADLPKHYEKHLDAFEFIKNVPVDWSERIILNSSMSEYVTIARKDKNSNNWYIGGITDEKERNFVIDFSFLDDNMDYKITIYTDTKNTHWKDNPMEYEIKNDIITSKDNINIYLAPGGGFAFEIKEVTN